jgi:general stress protein 26
MALLVATAWAQAPEWGPALAAARAIVENAEYCFLITMDAGGQPQARLMQPFAPAGDFTIWMGTHPRTRKVEQIRANPKVTVAYQDAKAPGYVTLIGTAKVVDSLEARKAHWRDDWGDFFPGGPAGSNYALIEFKPQRIELISAANEMVTAAGAPPVIIERRGESWRLLAKPLLK